MHHQRESQTTRLAYRRLTARQQVGHGVIQDRAAWRLRENLKGLGSLRTIRVEVPRDLTAEEPVYNGATSVPNYLSGRDGALDDSRYDAQVISTSTR